jgi:hypothetical protein
VNRSGVIYLHGNYKGKPHVVNGHHLEHYIACTKFDGTVEELNLQSPEVVIEKKYPLPDIRN